MYFLGISKGVDKSAAKLPSRDEGSRIAVNVAKLPALCEPGLTLLNHQTRIALTTTTANYLPTTSNNNPTMPRQMISQNKSIVISGCA